jgi:hypothetical protein
MQFFWLENAILGTVVTAVPFFNILFPFSTQIQKSINGIKTESMRQPYPYASYETDPSEKDMLFKYQTKFFPDRVEIWADYDQDGTPELLEVHNVTVPWSEVHVHLVGKTFVPYRTFP